MINEEINDQAFSVVARISELTLNEIKKAIEKITADLKSGKYDPMNIKNAITGEKSPELKHGQMTLKQLSKHNDGLSAVELTDPNLRQLYREMKRHNIDFAAVKDGKGKYTLFFKGKDADSMTHAFKQYTQKVVNRAHSNKPSINKTLAAAKKLTQALGNQVDKVKNRDRGARDR